jgi:hypothetical protein
MATSETLDKFAQRLGMAPSETLDALHRSDFASDDAYLDACARRELEHSDPTYRATRSRLEAQYRERQEAAQRLESERAYQRIRTEIKLDDADTKRIDREAADLARRDLAAGKIPASALGETIAEYAAQLTERQKDRRAGSQLFNEMLRGR